MAIVVEARKRDGIGRRSTGKMRREGKIPGVFYLRGEESVPLLFDGKSLTYLVQHSHGLLDLAIEGEKSARKCVLKDVQYDPVTEIVLHVDFQGVVMGEKMVVTVPLTLVGEPAGLREGGILTSFLRELTVECMPKFIPEMLEVDVAGLNVGDSLHVSDLKFDNLDIQDDAGVMIALVDLPKMKAEATEDDAEDDAEDDVEDGGNAETGG